MPHKNELDVFTPELKAAGVNLFTSASTRDIIQQQIDPSKGGFIRTQPTPFEESGMPIPQFPDVNRTSRIIPELQQAPVGVQSSSFGPDVPTQLPEDDFLTPPGVLSPSELQEKGGILSSLGSALSSPAGIKFIASLGASISPQGLLPTGQFAIESAEADAQQQFSELLDIAGPNVPASQINIPGLSAEGRASILETRRKTDLEERRETRLETGLEIDKTRESRAAALHSDNLKLLGQRVAAGEISIKDARAEAAFTAKLRELGPQNSEELLIAGAALLDIELPQNVDLNNIPFDKATELLQEVERTKRARISKQPSTRAGASGAILSQAQKGAKIGALQNQKINLLQKQQGFKGLTATEVRLLNEIDSQLQKLGVVRLDIDPDAIGGGASGIGRANKLIEQSRQKK